jgi:hypothetical protein
VLLGSGNNSDGNHFNTQLPFGKKEKERKRNVKKGRDVINYS